MKKLHRVIVVLLTLYASFALVPSAFAHPLGNFTINQYVGLNVSREKVLLDYVLDMAEIPAFQEIAAFDANGNGQADPSETAGYPADKCNSLRADLSLLLNNRPTGLDLTSSSVEFPAGVGGLPTLRLVCKFQAAYTSEEISQLSFRNNAFAERLGWREIVIVADDVSITGNFAGTSLSNRLTKYPADLLTSPLDQRQVEFKVKPIALSERSESSAVTTATTSPLADRNDAFTRLILLEEINLPALLLALAISFIWGAMHAMTPGHGKTIVGAYLVGSRGTIKHAVYLGLTTTITHTLGVFALGLITLFAAQFIVPEKLYPWMSLLSGLFVLGIGLNLFTDRFRSSGLGTWLGTLKTKLWRSPRLYSPVLEHTHAEGLIHQHKYVLNTSHEHHDGNIHAHDHDGHHHDHTDEHHHNHNHDHADHSHLPPGADGSPVTWRSLLALGISGGLLPCPSALVVLLGAIALNRIGFGLILVLAFSLGLAGALTAIGMMFIYAGRLFERFPSHGKIIRILPVLSALFVSAIGVAISIKALAEIGIV
jgi:ABC-type nickel/cobalt efflux system permease component RcnA